MALIEWNNNLSVGVDGIDTQHKKLVQMINELNDAMKQGKGKDIIGKIINELINYTQGHFALEEKYFIQTNYPASDAHKIEHKDFVKKVADFRDGFNSGKLGVSIEVMNFLSSWLKNHIQGTDKKYSSHFISNGIK